MVDPMNITKFDRTEEELQEFAIFAICVAGKTAKTIAPRVTELIDHIRFALKRPDLLPLDCLACVRGIKGYEVGQWLRFCGIGCYDQKAKALLRMARLVRAGKLNLRTCSVSELEQIPWCGPKTARFIILHSRANAEVAALDTHILKHLAVHGLSVPKSTPSKGKLYTLLENAFLLLASKAGMSPADYDLMVWRHYSAGVPLTAA